MILLAMKQNDSFLALSLHKRTINCRQIRLSNNLENKIPLDSYERLGSMFFRTKANKIRSRGLWVIKVGFDLLELQEKI